MITSTFGSVNHATAPPLEMHPEDAKARGLSTGMRVRVWNNLGEVHLLLRVTDVIPRGVVCSLKGACRRYTPGVKSTIVRVVCVAVLAAGVTAGCVDSGLALRHR